MTAPGGDIEPEAPETQAEETPLEAGAASRRGPDWVAILAWGGAVVVALVLGGLVTVGLQSVGAPKQGIADWWRATTAERPSGDEREATGPRPPTDEASVKESDAPAPAHVDDAGRIIVNPAWMVSPRPEFPTRALRQGVESGRVQLECLVKADGAVRSCRILSETPSRAGFGEAALKGAARARIQPRTVDGVATDARIRFSVAFRLQ